MLSLGQKLKMPKTCQKHFYKDIRALLCEETLGKKHECMRNDTILKIGDLAKAIAFAKCSVWVKN